MKTFTYDNVTIYLGENAQENWDLVTRAHPDYWWFHLSSFPSSHVVLCSFALTNSLRNECVRLCREHSKFRKIPNLKVDYTLVSNLRKGDEVGEVYYKRPRLVQTT